MKTKTQEFSLIAKLVTMKHSMGTWLRMKKLKILSKQILIVHHPFFYTGTKQDTEINNQRNGLG